jgi:hypothetical protein
MMTRLGPFLALAALLLAASPAGAIQGGAPARGGDALSRATVAVGALLRPDEDDIKVTRCTGVLIGRDRVMTAGHCVRDNPLGAMVMFYQGSRPVGPALPVASVSRYAVAPGAVAESGLVLDLAQLTLDVAVLRLAAPVRDRGPVSLARRGRTLPTTLELAGIGLSGGTAGLLRTTRLRPLGITETGLTIARTVGSLVCTGDSGGPVVEMRGGRPQLWGVVSAVITTKPPCGDIVVIAPAT